MDSIRRIKIIVCVSENRVIGNQNRLIWYLPNDLKRFKETTMGHPIVMGRKTYQSIGKSLTGRRNIVISRQDFKADCEVVSSLEEALTLCNSDCFIIGGGEIYKQSIDKSDKIYLTLIHQEFEGDTFFPEMGDEWVEVNREDFEPDKKNPYHYSFIEYEKR